MMSLRLPKVSRVFEQENIVKGRKFNLKIRIRIKWIPHTDPACHFTILKKSVLFALLG